MALIYLVEDNESLREAVRSYLRLNDHEVVEFGRVAGVEEAVRTRPPRLMILDVMLPDGDGFLLARRLRRGHSMPIIFLTAKSAESDRITGFEVGADDYVVKPFSTRELVLRVEAVLRRTGVGTAGEAARGEAAPGETAPGVRSWHYAGKRLELDAAAHRARVEGRELNLTGAEWKVLVHLAESAGLVLARERLLGESLDYLVAEGSERTVDTHVKNLRAKLGDPGWIDTVRGFGYRFAGTPSGPAREERRRR